MPLYRTEAIVMGGWNLGEADRIVSFYTRRMGRIRGVAAGVRRVRSKFGGRLQLFTHGTLLCFAKENRGLCRINEFEPLDSFQGLRSDLGRLSHASYLVELTSLLVWEGEISEETFLLLLRALRRLEAGVEVFHAERAFEIGLLLIAGYLPELGRCVRCKRPPARDQGASLAPEEGGILCPDCQTKFHPSLPLTPPSLVYLQEARGGDLGKLLGIPLSWQERTEISSAMRAYFNHILQKRMHTLDFMAQLEKATGG